MIAVVDYKKGNLKSVERALCNAGAEVCVTQDPERIHEASAIVLPGVGAFTDAMNTMNELGQTEAIKDALSDGIPFLGICLGMHLMYEIGHEHALSPEGTEGLGILSGEVADIPRTDPQGNKFKVPHVGWNSVNMMDLSDPLFRGIPDGSFFYFTHSYMAPNGNNTTATTKHSVTFPCAVRNGNAFGVQFHPEKSSDVGAHMIANFVDYARKA